MASKTSQFLPGSVNLPIATLPRTNGIKAGTDADGISQKIIDELNQAINQGDTQAAANLFHNDGYWRDHLALSFDLQTCKGKAGVKALLEKGHNLQKLEIDRSTPGGSPTISPFDFDQTVSGISFLLRIVNKHGSGRGVVTLVEDEEQHWRIWTCYIVLQELKDFKESLGPRRGLGLQHEAVTSRRKNWLDKRVEETSFQNSSPQVLVIGGGQAGLTIHARLKMLGVPTLIIDSNDEIGDNWRKRYHQLVLHDPVWYDHMPYVPFPDTWPVFTPKDKLGDFFKTYAQILELNVWTRTTIQSAKWNDAKKEWTVALERRSSDGSIESRILYPKHIVQATGHSGKRNVPSFKGWDSFRGRICHSSDFQDAQGNGQGRKAIVIGSCNSAMDIAQSYVESGYNVTMVQRSSTSVVSITSILELILAQLYSEGGPPTADADLRAWSIPAEVFKAIHKQIVRAQNQKDGEMLEGLKRVGFQTDNGPDGAGFFVKYLQRGGGYYIDVGAAQLIIDGKIKIAQGREVAEILPHGMKLSDGTELEADEIVVATGYQNMRTMTREILGDAVADKIGDVWGFDDSGELRTFWRKSGHDGFWLHGGNMAICRYFSRVLALQIKAELEGLN